MTYETDEILSPEPAPADGVDVPVVAVEDVADTEDSEDVADVEDGEDGFYVPPQPGQRGTIFVKGVSDGVHSVTRSGGMPVHPSER